MSAIKIAGNASDWDRISFEKSRSEEAGNSDNRLLIMKRFSLMAVQIALTDRQKKIYYKKIVENKTVKKIANETGITPSTVYKHLKLADKRIKKLKELFVYSLTGKDYQLFLAEEFKTKLKTLKPDVAGILSEYYLKKLTAEEIAGRRGLTYGCVIGRLQQARKLLLYKGFGKTELKEIRSAPDGRVRDK